ncbi:S-layer homology domain-containing protein, partial [Candidatus Falkowbacteria bacterium]|nr:S-layer homology domain-containing protein [Candidatus Falkowbacteria bacterium]
ELVRLILRAGGYGEVASLSGIYRCAFRDEQSIPAQYYGYAALAQGLGLVSGDSSGNFACGRAATRAEAAVMLYHLMSK